jgi:hypothetical protein
MPDMAPRVFRAGHLPVIWEWFALPLFEHAGSQRVGNEIFNEIFYPIARRLLERCDGCLRIGCPSQGADEMAALARQAGRFAFNCPDQLPPVLPTPH